MHQRTLYKRMLMGTLVLAVAATAGYGIIQRSGTSRAATQNVTGEGLSVQGERMCLDLQ
jgi:hypothetical protein